MKERIMGAALMLLIAVVMTASVTFAWITLSRTPEVKGMDTTVSANGSLEIALVQGDGSEYPTSGRGDSSAVDNNVARSNVTWGNLVNLSDASYGIQNIALRPALLNKDRLLSAPLQAAKYGWDGRVTTLDSDYTFAKWDGYEFTASNEKGVRAIAAYKLTVSEATSARVKNMIARAEQKVTNAMNAVNNQYKNNVMSTNNMNGLKGLLSAYVSGAVRDKLNGESGNAENTDISEHLPKIYNLYNEFYQAMELQQTSLTELANFQRYVDSLASETEYTELTWEEISRDKAKYNASSLTAASQNGVVHLTGLTSFINDMNRARTDLETLRVMYEDNRDNGTRYVYSSISDIVYRLAGTSSATVNGKTLNNIGTSDALGMLSSPDIQLTAGFLKNFEQLAVQSGYRMDVTMTIPIDTTGLSSLYSAFLSGGIKNAHVTTNVSGSCYTEAEFSKVSNSSLELVPGDKVATDNYGLAVDLWVRTNADNTYLLLDGHLEQEVREVRSMGTDGSGSPVELFSAQVSEGGTTGTVDVYQKNEKWYYNGSDVEATVIGVPTAKLEEVVTITGYSGSNRVWSEEDKPLITSDSTTQGNGSCYVFYADTPEEQAKFLKLLEAFRVAFVSRGGELLTTALLDTDHYFAVNGKITVPLVVKDPAITTELIDVLDESGNPVLNEYGEPLVTEVSRPLLDANDEPIYAITKLEKNQATMLTAIIYLDGSLLSNNDVLAASSIQGQLNFQFASTERLFPANDAPLEQAERTITASVDKTSYDFGEDEDLSIHIRVQVEGDVPANVSAFFQRAINSTQGKRMEVMNFTSAGEGAWNATYSFYAPGEYYLREVMLDGVSYRLNDPIHVTVSGFAPDYVGWGEADDIAVVFTANNNYLEPVYISFGMDDSISRTTSVRMVFMNDENGNAVSTKMSYDPIRMLWSGTATFGMSGTYRLRFVVVNGEYYDLGEYNDNFVKTITLNLGLHAEVGTSSAQRDFFVANTVFEKDMTVEIFDNSGNAMVDLRGAVLTYSRGSSTTDTVSAPLTWNEVKNCYTGTLAITRPGSYSFLDVTVNSNRVTRASSSPTFLLRNPDPVSYNTASISNFHGSDNVQFVPILNNAYMGPIRINNSDTAFISAVVHNNLTNQDYTITQSSDATKSGTMYYDAGAWYINLPTYREALPDGTFGDYMQDGEWTLSSISLWDVMDVNGVEHTVSNKLVWTDGQDGYDFSSLSTVVSSTINVLMEMTGSADLGDQNTPFMTVHRVANETGMRISVLDNAGRPIPMNKISDISLNLSYTDNTDRSYGYIVSGYSRQPVMTFNAGGTDGYWTASEDLLAQYVGQYVVKDLTVTMTGNEKITIDPGTQGVPNMITVTSAGPENNLKYTVRQNVTELGKTGSNVTATFLQQLNPAITVTARVTYEDEAGVERTAQYAVMDDLAVKLQLTYKDGKTAPNGGYSWTGTSALEMVEMTLNPGENTSNGIPYTTGSTSLLAGRYSIAGTITLNGQTVPLNHTFSDVNVYSIRPTAKFTGVTPAVNTEITIFQPSTSAGDYTDYIWNEDNLVSVKNFYNDTFANIYISATEGDGCPHYEIPRVTVALSGMGTQFTSAALSFPNASSSGDASFSFSSSSFSATQGIGYVESKTETLAEGGTCGSDSTVTYEIPRFAGSATASSVQATSGGVTYTVQLTSPITVRQTNETPPSISFAKVNGYTMPQAEISQDGQSFVYTLPSSINTKSEQKTEAVGDADWVQSGDPTTSKLTYVSSEKDGKRSTTGCNAQTYYYYNHTYNKYTRTTTVYTMTTSTETYEVVYGVTGWIVDGVTYGLGDSVTVTGHMVAEPIISELSRTLLGSSTKSGQKTVKIDSYDGQETIKGGESTQSQAASRTLYNLPSGYTWGNSSNKYDGSWVNEAGEVTEVWN
ncbi:MAG: hypothetical protein IK088_06415 [Lachnospiraceae bacterium]|nr:hypothetical protein [Lachnospiraceae bacterium]